MLKFENEEVEKKYHDMLRDSRVGHISFEMGTVITGKDLESLSKDLESISEILKKHKIRNQTT